MKEERFGKKLSTDNFLPTSKEVSFWHCYHNCLLSVEKNIRNFLCNVFYLWSFVVLFAKCFRDVWGKTKRIWAKNVHQHSHNCILAVQRNALEKKVFKKISSDFELGRFAVWEKIFLHFFVKRKTSCAEKTSLHFFCKNIVFFVWTSSWKNWEFERKFLDCGGKGFSSFLIIDFYVTRRTLWEKSWEKIFEYKVFLLIVSERLFELQQTFFANILKTAFHSSRGTIWKYFVSFWKQICFWHRAKFFRGLIKSFQQCSQNCISHVLDNWVNCWF